MPLQKYGATTSMTVQSSGTEVVNTGVDSAAQIVTGGIQIVGGLLKLDVSSAFSDTIVRIVNSAQAVDLVDVAFSAAVLAYSGTTLSSVLTVSDTLHTAQLALIGNYTLASFHVPTDRNGGTLITDPPVSSGAGLASPN